MTGNMLVEYKTVCKYISATGKVSWNVSAAFLWLLKLKPAYALQTPETVLADTANYHGTFKGERNATITNKLFFFSEVEALHVLTDQTGIRNQLCMA